MLKNHFEESNLNIVSLRIILFSMINSTASDTLTHYFNFFIHTADQTAIFFNAIRLQTKRGPTLATAYFERD